jgi:Nuclease-related domain
VGTSGPGASARRDDERLNRDDDAHVLRERRFIGLLIERMQEESTTVRPWERGASGERIVGARLDRITDIEVLHDRKMPGSRATIGHIAVGPGGVYVIEAKLYGSMVKHRGAKVLRHDRRVRISGHDETLLVAKIGTQVNAISRALFETPIPVTAALCFVDAQWPLPAEPFMLNGVWVGWPDALADLVGRPGLLDAEAMRTTARLLDSRLPVS